LITKAKFYSARLILAGCALGLLFFEDVAFRPIPKAGLPNETSVDAIYAPFDSIKTDMNDYIWPISVRPKITSSFAEFRSSHFHAGLDIGTGDRIGENIYASRDGYVARIEISPYGYGRFLVLRHPDGFYTTYAHLSAYMDPLERAVRAEQLKEGKFSIIMKFQPGDFPVRKGEVVAYSGESGSGSAHLHFEIRDENFNPVNPLLFPNIRQFHDTEPPVFRRLAISPMDENSFVDYEFAPKIYRARTRSRSSYSIDGVIRATGAIGFSIDAADRFNNTRYRSSVYSFEFQIDGKTIFTSRRDRFPEDETRQVGLDFDWAMWKERKGRFQKLYVDEGNTLPFYDRRSQLDGIVNPANCSEGTHQFKIIASDYSGNTSVLAGTFVLNHPPKVEIVSASDRSVTAYMPNSDKVASVEVGTKGLSSRSWKVQEFSAKNLGHNGDSLSLPVDLKSADVVRVIAKNIWGTRSFPVYHFLTQPHSAGEATISTEEEGAFLRVRLSSSVPFTAMPSLQIQQEHSVSAVPLHAIDVNDYTGIYKLSETYSGTSYVKAFVEIGGKRSEVFNSFTMNTVSPSQGRSIRSDDGNFVITFPAGSVFSPLHPIVTQRGPLRYEVYPRDVLLRDGMSVSMNYPAEMESDDQLALYVNSGGGWNFLGTERNRQTHTLVLRDGLTLGTFAILDDTRKPVISRWHASSINQKRHALFSFKVRDNLSGIDDDHLTAHLNGEPIMPEYDPEKRIVFYDPIDPLPRGRYTLQIDVKDRVGNDAHLAKTISIYR